MATNVPLLENDDTLGFGEENEPKGKLKHPIVTVFHLFFRTAAIVIYVFCGKYSFIGSFVAVVLLLSVDFWTVKNITGRLMVGLRWWNYVDDEGKSHWVYETRKGALQGRVSPLEVRIFWSTLVITPVLWSIFLLLTLIHFQLGWFMLVCIAITLSGSNVYGYLKCKIGKSNTITDSFKNVTSRIIQTQMMSNVTSMFTRAPRSRPEGPTSVV